MMTENTTANRCDLYMVMLKMVTPDPRRWAEPWTCGIFEVNSQWKFLLPETSMNVSPLFSKWNSLYWRNRIMTSLIYEVYTYFTSFFALLLGTDFTLTVFKWKLKTCDWHTSDSLNGNSSWSNGQLEVASFKIQLENLI